MNSDPLSELWTCDANRHGPAEGERIAADVVARMRRRRRFQAWWLAWTFFALATTSLFALLQVRGNVASPNDPAALWALVPLLILPWLAAVHFLCAFLCEKNPPANVAQPLPDVLGAMRAANVREQRRLVVVLVLLAATAPFAAFAVRQLEVVGKLAPNEAASMTLVFGIGLALGIAAVVLRLRYRLRPERRKVESLLRDLETPAVH